MGSRRLSVAPRGLSPTTLGPGRGVLVLVLLPRPHRSGRDPPGPRGRRRFLRPLSVLAEIRSRFLLALTFEVTAGAEPEEEVDQAHRGPAPDGQRKSVAPEAAWRGQ